MESISPKGKTSLTQHTFPIILWVISSYKGQQRLLQWEEASKPNLRERRGTFHQSPWSSFLVIDLFDFYINSLHSSVQTSCLNSRLPQICSLQTALSTTPLKDKSLHGPEPPHRRNLQHPAWIITLLHRGSDTLRANDTYDRLTIPDDGNSMNL